MYLYPSVIITIRLSIFLKIQVNGPLLNKGGEKQKNLDSQPQNMHLLIISEVKSDHSLCRSNINHSSTFLTSPHGQITPALVSWAAGWQSVCCFLHRLFRKWSENLPFSFTHTFWCMLTCTPALPCHNRNGWQGVKHQVTYLCTLTLNKCLFIASAFLSWAPITTTKNT